MLLVGALIALASAGVIFFATQLLSAHLEYRHGAEVYGSTAEGAVSLPAHEDLPLSTIEVTDGNIKSFERTARKYGVTFSLKKDKTQTPPRYIVFFRGKDVDVIQQAFKEFSAAETVKANKPSIRKRLAKSLQRNQNQQKQHEKVKEKDKGLEQAR